MTTSDIAAPLPFGEGKEVYMRAEMRALWERKSQGDYEARRQLVLEYMPMARRIAASVWKTTPSQVELEDLVSYATMGLLRAVDNYDLHRGVSFETYGPVTIRGGILDELRSLDWLPRSHRRRQRDIDKARQELESRGHTVSLQDISDHLDISIEEIEETLRMTDSGRIKSLDEITSFDDDDRGHDHYNALSCSDPDPEDRNRRQKVHGGVDDVITSASPQERLVICLYYFEGLTLSEVGAVIGIPESRASQIHARLIMDIRETMQSNGK